MPVLVRAGEGAPGAPDPISGGTLLQLLASLVAVLLVFVALAWLLRRFSSGQPAGGGRLKVIEGLPLGPRDRLLLVQVGEKQLLLGQSPGRLVALHVLEEPLPASAPGTGFREGFRQVLQRRLGEGE
ncbi:MAG: flagellar biosynthetic protein FliO [Gammaproteobacteria bacterium]|nr:MAG: flagellar biosynthetic protein FliO [Gammaproteobacteria bacterium]